MKFAIVIEKAEDNWSAYAPDLPGCIATGRTAVEARDRLRDAIRLHIDGMQEDGETPPVPTTLTDTVEV
jgi:predicted RNase H-like HicB family nuclease